MIKNTKGKACKLYLLEIFEPQLDNRNSFGGWNNKEWKRKVFKS